VNSRCSRGDSSVLVITAEGVEYLEDNYQADIQSRRLKAKSD
jgi:hypothetical protein